jgi:hypothetical protein
VPDSDLVGGNFQRAKTGQTGAMKNDKCSTLNAQCSTQRSDTSLGVCSDDDQNPGEAQLQTRCFDIEY